MRATAWNRIAWIFNQTHILSHLFKHNYTQVYLYFHTHTHRLTEITCQHHFARPQWDTPSTFTAGNRAMKRIPDCPASHIRRHTYTLQIHLLREIVGYQMPTWWPHLCTQRCSVMRKAKHCAPVRSETRNTKCLPQEILIQISSYSR